MPADVFGAGRELVDGEEVQVTVEGDDTHLCISSALLVHSLRRLLETARRGHRRAHVLLLMLQLLLAQMTPLSQLLLVLGVVVV